MRQTYIHIASVIIIAVYLGGIITLSIAQQTSSQSYSTCMLFSKHEKDKRSPAAKSDPVKTQQRLLKAKNVFSFSTVIAEKPDTDLKKGAGLAVYIPAENNVCLYAAYCSRSDRAPPQLKFLA